MSGGDAVTGPAVYSVVAMMVVAILIVSGVVSFSLGMPTNRHKRSDGVERVGQFFHLAEGTPQLIKKLPERQAPGVQDF
jgi:hypothetical protein